MTKREPSDEDRERRRLRREEWAKVRREVQESLDRLHARLVERRKSYS
jgi:hypothetical protein